MTKTMRSTRGRAGACTKSTDPWAFAAFSSSIQTLLHVRLLSASIPTASTSLSTTQSSLVHQPHFAHKRSRRFLARVFSFFFLFFFSSFSFSSFSFSSSSSF